MRHWTEITPADAEATGLNLAVDLVMAGIPHIDYADLARE